MAEQVGSGCPAPVTTQAPTPLATDRLDHGERMDRGVRPAVGEGRPRSGGRGRRRTRWCSWATGCARDPRRRQPAWRTSRPHRRRAPGCRGERDAVGPAERSLRAALDEWLVLTAGALSAWRSRPTGDMRVRPRRTRSPEGRTRPSPIHSRTEPPRVEAPGLVGKGRGSCRRGASRRPRARGHGVRVRGQTARQVPTKPCIQGLRLHARIRRAAILRRARGGPADGATARCHRRKPGPASPSGEACRGLRADDIHTGTPDEVRRSRARIRQKLEQCTEGTCRRGRHPPADEQRWVGPAAVGRTERSRSTPRGPHRRLRVRRTRRRRSHQHHEMVASVTARSATQSSGPRSCPGSCRRDHNRLG